MSYTAASQGILARKLDELPCRVTHLLTGLIGPLVRYQPCRTGEMSSITVSQKPDDRYLYDEKVRLIRVLNLRRAHPSWSNPYQYSSLGILISTYDVFSSR